jgi:hypothetical protein
LHIYISIHTGHNAWTKSADKEPARQATGDYSGHRRNENATYPVVQVRPNGLHIYAVHNPISPDESLKKEDNGRKGWTTSDNNVEIKGA